MKLQYSAMGSNGEIWIDCQNRFDELITKAAEHHGHTVEQVTNNGLLKGMMIPLPADGWYVTKLRDLDSIKPPKQTPAPTTDCHCKLCGQTGRSGGYPFSTLPDSGVCDDCL